MTDEFGWLIEHGHTLVSRPTYWAGPDFWSPDHAEAIRFARKVDAERVASRLGVLCRVCEHGWG